MTPLGVPKGYAHVLKAVARVISHTGRKHPSSTTSTRQAVGILLHQSGALSTSAVSGILSRSRILPPQYAQARTREPTPPDVDLLDRFAVRGQIEQLADDRQWVQLADVCSAHIMQRVTSARNSLFRHSHMNGKPLALGEQSLPDAGAQQGGNVRLQVHLLAEADLDTLQHAFAQLLSIREVGSTHACGIRPGGGSSEHSSGLERMHVALKLIKQLHEARVPVNAVVLEYCAIVAGVLRDVSSLNGILHAVRTHAHLIARDSIAMLGDEPLARRFQHRRGLYAAAAQSAANLPFAGSSDSALHTILAMLSARWRLPCQNVTVAIMRVRAREGDEASIWEIFNAMDAQMSAGDHGGPQMIREARKRGPRVINPDQLHMHPLVRRVVTGGIDFERASTTEEASDGAPRLRYSTYEGTIACLVDVAYARAQAQFAHFLAQRARVLSLRHEGNLESETKMELEQDIARSELELDAALGSVRERVNHVLGRMLSSGLPAREDVIHHLYRLTIVVQSTYKGKGARNDGNAQAADRAAELILAGCQSLGIVPSPQLLATVLHGELSSGRPQVAYALAHTILNVAQQQVNDLAYQRSQASGLDRQIRRLTVNPSSISLTTLESADGGVPLALAQFVAKGLQVASTVSGVGGRTASVGLTSNPGLQHAPLQRSILRALSAGNDSKRFSAFASEIMANCGTLDYKSDAPDAGLDARTVHIVLTSLCKEPRAAARLLQRLYAPNVQVGDGEDAIGAVHAPIPQTDALLCREVLYLLTQDTSIPSAVAMQLACNALAGAQASFAHETHDAGSDVQAVQGAGNGGNEMGLTLHRVHHLVRGKRHASGQVTEPDLRALAVAMASARLTEYKVFSLRWLSMAVDAEPLLAMALRPANTRTQASEAQLAVERTRALSAESSAAVLLEAFPGLLPALSASSDFMRAALQCVSASTAEDGQSVQLTSSPAGHTLPAHAAAADLRSILSALASLTNCARSDRRVQQLLGGVRKAEEAAGRARDWKWSKEEEEKEVKRWRRWNHGVQSPEKIERQVLEVGQGPGQNEDGLTAIASLPGSARIKYASPRSVGFRAFASRFADMTWSESLAVEKKVLRPAAKEVDNMVKLLQEDAKAASQSQRTAAGPLLLSIIAPAAVQWAGQFAQSR